MPPLGSRASQRKKLLEVHYENIMILDDPVMTLGLMIKLLVIRP